MTVASELLSAIVGGATEALPLSGRGHLALLAAMENGRIDDVLRGAVALGSFLALVIAARKRWVEIFRGGWARDLAGLVIANAVAIPGALFLSRESAALSRAPLAHGIGMVITAIMLASTLTAPAQRRTQLGTEQALALGLSMSLAALPGGSFTGAAFAALVWTGVSRKHAVDLAFVAAAPQALIGLVAIVVKPGALPQLHERPGTAVVLLSVTLAAGLAGTSIFRRLAERRVAEMAGFLAAVASAFVAYAWTLTGSAA